MNRPTRFFIWNIMGANNDNFRRNFRELINTYNPCMAALLETRMESHTALRDDFNFSDMIEGPAQGRSGGLVILW